jgi:hypothetical protein
MKKGVSVKVRVGTGWKEGKIEKVKKVKNEKSDGTIEIEYRYNVKFDDGTEKMRKVKWEDIKYADTFFKSTVRTASQMKSSVNSQATMNGTNLRRTSMQLQIHLKDLEDKLLKNPSLVELSELVAQLRNLVKHVPKQRCRPTVRVLRMWVEAMVPLWSKILCKTETDREEIEKRELGCKRESQIVYLFKNCGLSEASAKRLIAIWRWGNKAMHALGRPTKGSESTKEGEESTKEGEESTTEGEESTTEKKKDERQWAKWSLLFATRMVEMANKEIEALLGALEKYTSPCEDGDEDGTSK